MAVSGNPQLNIRLEIDLMDKVKVKAGKQGMSPQEWVRRLIKETLGEVSTNVVLAVDNGTATGISRDDLDTAIANLRNEIQEMISESIALALASQAKSEPEVTESVAVDNVATNETAIAPISEPEVSTFEKEKPPAVSAKVAVDPFVVGSTYPKAELRKMFTLYQPFKDGKQAKVQDKQLETWLIKGASKPPSNTLAQLVGFPEMWRADNVDAPKTFTYLGKNNESIPVTEEPKDKIIRLKPLANPSPEWIKKKEDEGYVIEWTDTNDTSENAL